MNRRVETLNFFILLLVAVQVTRSGSGNTAGRCGEGESRRQELATLRGV